MKDKPYQQLTTRDNKPKSISRTSVLNTKQSSAEKLGPYQSGSNFNPVSEFKDNARKNLISNMVDPSNSILPDIASKQGLTQSSSSVLSARRLQSNVKRYSVWSNNTNNNNSASNLQQPQLQNKDILFVDNYHTIQQKR